MTYARAGLVVLLMSACTAAEPMASRSAAATSELVLLPAGSTWWVSAVGGDRGTAWRQPSYDPAASGGWLERVGPTGYGESYLASTIPYGFNAAAKPVTVYFVREFFVENPAGFTALRLETMYDDGFVAYLNGEEAVRAHMPTGTVGYTTRAHDHEAQSTYASFDLSSMRESLRPGTNMLAIEIHQTGPASSDLVFDAALVGTTSPPPAPGAGIARGSTWRYWDRGGDLGTAWRASGFDDSAWAAGAGPLGYGESYLATTVSYGPNAAAKPMTTYFRRQFTVDDPSAIERLEAELMYDDGAVIYLNGTEIQRPSMPAQVAISASTPAFDHEAEGRYLEIDWTSLRGLLVAGVNTVAVEVHQNNPGSSDLVFDLAVTTELAGPPLETSIARGSTWRYWDRGGTPGDWTQVSYDDSSWAEGAGPLGYGESYLATNVSYGPDASHKYITTYFRKKFWIESRAEIRELRGQLMFDDGAIVWFNGELAGRHSMPAEGWSASTPGFDHEANNTYVPFNWSGGVVGMVTGENVIAVEIHQAGPVSSDMVFDLALEVVAAPLFRRHPENPVLSPSGTTDEWDRIGIFDPSVVRLGPSSWVMFYAGNEGGNHYRIGRAVSTDGVHWTADAQPVLSGGRDPSVLYDGTIYRMWYSALDDNGVEGGIRLATSTNGISWSNVGSGPVIAGGPAGSWYERVSSPYVIRDGSVYRMWIEGTHAIGHATSADGVTWTVGAQPVLLPPPFTDSIGEPTVLKDEGIYKLWYTTTNEHGNLHAISPDGLVWDTRGSSLHMGPTNQWDYAWVGGGTVLRDAGILKMWYAGFPELPHSGISQIGYATYP